MITMIEARTAQGTLLSLPLGDESSGLKLVDVDGLGPVKATLASSSFASLDGEQFQSSRRGARDITLKLKLDPDYITESVEDLRDKLYDFFMPESPVDLRAYRSDGLVVDISGWVEDFDSPHFTNEPTADILIRCFNPDFVDIVPIEIEGSTVSDSTDTVIDYPGTVKTGFVLALSIDRPISGFTIYCKKPDNTIQTFDFAAAMVAGNTIIVSTVAGEKSIMRATSSNNGSMLYGLATQSVWPEIVRGENQFRVYVAGAPISYTLTYEVHYGGL